MTTSYRAMTWSGTGLQEVDQAAEPLAGGWARVQVAACGICGGDLYSWRDPSKRRIGSTAGHESPEPSSPGPPA